MLHNHNLEDLYSTNYRHMSMFFGWFPFITTIGVNNKKKKISKMSIFLSVLEGQYYYVACLFSRLTDERWASKVWLKDFIT